MSGKTNEITAEWTVHAQLTISHPGDGTSGADGGDPKPVTVVYKWSSDDAKNAIEKNGNSTGNVSFTSSTNRQEADGPDKVPQCKSTCSIVLSACADLFPINAQNKYDPNTKINIDSAQLAHDEGSSVSRLIPLKDAFSQTSDCEMLKRSSVEKISSLTEKKNKTYDYRRKTESMLSPPPAHMPQTPVDEGKVNSSQYGLSRSPNRYSPSYTSPTSSKRGGGAKKPPRTVHIDVYCTASDGENSSTSSSSVSSANRDPVEDVESNSTPQTVYESQQMKLMHKRAGKFDMPRRMGGSRSGLESSGSGTKLNLASLSRENVRQLSSKSSIADEINESKQMLFDKHLGGSSSGSRMSLLRQRLIKDTSDDCLSSNYPNSSYSTFRDMTVSSISSAQASSSALFEDIMETSWKESDLEASMSTHPPHASSVAQSSDSFEYDNANDRNRIKQMEELWQRKSTSTDKVWNSPQAERKFLMQQQRMNEFMKQKEQGEKMKLVLGVLETDDSEHSGNISESERSYTPLVAKNLCPNVMVGMGMSVKEPSPASTAKTVQSTIPEDQQRREASEPKDLWPGLKKPPPTFLNFTRDSESASSSLVSHLSGYTHEYLAKARKFGAVVGALRKPGHHVGPAKNPECQCEHCRRWMAERDKGRGRSTSISEIPLTFEGFRTRRNYI
ncbi:uncharacterized protein LOC129804407 isoform X2 [Phlebotomus papatasi]|uniref:uncharacterized protein LOC129804407 isoform X2 n=1 Tax=Phlebotomus papatasi TaxID=29031 RepID=UPI00248424D9|nr:uncharacterized protein LOC129804407 isoform X2 [Phlebotomus papatasi]XP_055707644.1 uncharacterized protein LOC129804407 isoform X2 [Phlebotomus papatasi]